MKYFRILEITNVEELNFIKIALNQSDIDYRILFEKSLELHTLTTTPNTGAMLEVGELDLQKAEEVLHGLGIDITPNPDEDQFGVIGGIDEFTQDIPLIGNLSLGIRVLLFISFVVISLTSLVFLGMLTK